MPGARQAPRGGRWARPARKASPQSGPSVRALDRLPLGLLRVLGAFVRLLEDRLRLRLRVVAARGELLGQQLRPSLDAFLVARLVAFLVARFVSEVVRVVVRVVLG